MNFNRIVKDIGYGGSGGEAEVTIQLRNEFPGIGGTIITQQPILTALRINRNALPNYRYFVLSTIIKKLDDFFLRNGRYSYPHIARPIGSVGPNAHLHEWAHGFESFPWEESDGEGNYNQINLEEFGKFTYEFKEAGLNLRKDIVDCDSGRTSKNIIHEMPKIDSESSSYNLLWKRIDFGDGSIGIDYKELGNFLNQNKDELIKTLEFDRYEMIRLAQKYLWYWGDYKITEKEKGKLETLIQEYRLSTMRHLFKHQNFSIETNGESLS